MAQIPRRQRKPLLNKPVEKEGSVMNIHLEYLQGEKRCHKRQGKRETLAQIVISHVSAIDKQRKHSGEYALRSKL